MDQLPTSIISLVLLHLDPSDLCSAEASSSLFYALAKDGPAWPALAKRVLDAGNCETIGTVVGGCTMGNPSSNWASAWAQEAQQPFLDWKGITAAAVKPMRRRWVPCNTDGYAT